MSTSHHSYKVISDEAKARIRKLDIVSPSTYSSIFSDIARASDVDLGDESRVVTAALEEEIVNFNHVREQTSSHAEELNANAVRAVDAMEHQDDSLLQKVLDETIALRREIEALKGAVYKDALTKAYNRKWFNDRYLCTQSSTFRVDGILVLIDMNDFKAINDTFGHIVGDKVLVYVAKHLARTNGYVIRYGGDEFLVLFESEMSLEEATQKMHDIRETVLKKLFKIQDKTFKISFSLGLMPFSVGDAFADIIESSDVKMYQDKREIKARL